MAGLPRICDIERQKWCCNSDLLLNIRVLAGNRVQCPKVTGSEFIDRSRMRGMSVSTLSKIRRSSIQWVSLQIRVNNYILRLINSHKKKRKYYFHRIYQTDSTLNKKKTHITHTQLITAPTSK
ncbi:uncharacterized protein LOC102656349 isoform X1 [Apis mellifera]|uniref:Uncharacterized protein LOC102656349 isoform X1 n=1 Tax=Apis mellifera TaxID=7460 RepID=A0A7M7MVQ0_APIME|nr:uncharacterized protein LOC102656349 isoform X1 [Apis mellifera]|eukprot:XP_026301570.1 uncharacterized protein LOC102656349 isoform X1 [Apis mellifera]